MKYLSRSEASEFLTSQGTPVASKTLQKYASLGGGPTYQKFGNRALYTEQSLLKWVNEKISAPIKSTSELVRENGGMK